VDRPPSFRTMPASCRTGAARKSSVRPDNPIRVFVPGFVEPCLPSAAEHPPSGSGWLHEIKHDGFRLMVRRDAAGVRLLTRNGLNWSKRYPASLRL
jgi:ATP-dependent DNA ligase